MPINIVHLMKEMVTLVQSPLYTRTLTFNLNANWSLVTDKLVFGFIFITIFDSYFILDALDSKWIAPLDLEQTNGSEVQTYK